MTTIEKSMSSTTTVAKTTIELKSPTISREVKSTSVVTKVESSITIMEETKEGIEREKVIDRNAN
jgi:hypothetical protein